MVVFVGGFGWGDVVIAPGDGIYGYRPSGVLLFIFSAAQVCVAVYRNGAGIPSKQRAVYGVLFFIWVSLH